MSEQSQHPERSELNRTYTELSDLFRSGWTFHQFVQGVNKIFSSEQIDVEGVSFQGVYSKLKAVPAALQSDETMAVSKKLESAGAELSVLVERLVEIDAQVSPALLRRFFERVKNTDRKILGQLLRFLVLTRTQRWDADRQDKVDFLATRYWGGREGEFDHDGLLAEIWSEVQRDLPDSGEIDQQVDEAQAEVASLREAMSSLTGLEQFNQMGLIQGFRKVKHGLGLLVFEPRLMESLVNANIFVRQAVSGFYEMEERRIASEYQEVFELEREAHSVDDALDSELEDFRGQVEALERSIENQNVKLHNLVSVGSKARSLIPKLRRVSTEDGGAAGSGDGESRSSGGKPVADTAEMEATELPSNERRVEWWREGIEESRPQGALRIRTAYADVLGDSLRQLLQMLEGSDWKADPQAVTRTEEARPFRLEAREVVAYRRLHGSMRFDRDVEQFILEACALRLLISAQAEEIVSLLDVQRRRREGAPFEEGRNLCRVASLFESRFEHTLRQSLLSNRPEEARQLFQLRMRLLRDYSGLWLLVHG